MSAPQRVQADEPTTATVVALLIGLALGMLIAGFMAAMHAAGQGRIPW